MTQKNMDRSQASIESRRNMLKLGTCGAMTNATFLSTLMHLKMTSAVMAAPTLPLAGQDLGGYKALVCLFFSGAIDQFNVLTPHGTTQADAKYAHQLLCPAGSVIELSCTDASEPPGVAMLVTGIELSWMLLS